jgi:hypothetical protein
LQLLRVGMIDCPAASVAGDLVASTQPLRQRRFVEVAPVGISDPIEAQNS